MHDTIVIGLGAMGSATAYQLAKRGMRVLGIDRYEPPHTYGSHCGESRVTRLAIGEGEQYVPLVMRSHEIWRELEARSSESLLEIRGGLWISSARRGSEVHVADFFAKTLAAARRFGIPHERLDAEDIRRRFPVFKVRDDEQGYFEPGAGLVRPEACVRVQNTLAARSGAELRFGERVDRVTQRGTEVVVTTDRGEYVGSHAVLTAGAGMVDLLPPNVARLLTVTRQVQHWFEAVGHAEIPVWIWELQERQHGIYGFPSRAGVAKIATEVFAGDVSPQYMFESLVAPHIAGIAASSVKTVPCLYTSTPDSHFLIDRHPSMDQVLIASPCSGHGFKHSAAIGECLAQWVIEGKPALDLSSFALRRFTS
ncbi:MAG TPA: N-methyl-L-tryptophan oxidase [Vicinamibacterales bacterium]|nr:N-methyl-L-tryptophan oxidase [Vicinamibacterales bacterium]